MDKRRGQQPDVIRELLRLRLCKYDDLVTGALANAVPKTAIPCEVMIAGQEPPSAGMSIHTRDGLHNSAVLGTFGIEDVASDNDVLGAMLGSCPPKRVDRVEAGFRQGSANVGFKSPVGFAELPVGGMDELHPQL